MVECLASRVADLCGYEPDSDTCVDFLTKLAGSSRPISTRRPQSSSKSIDRPIGNNSFGEDIGFMLRGETHRCRNATSVMSSIIEALVAADSSFPERFEARKHGAKRRYLSRTKEELYPGRPDLCEIHSLELGFGWYLGTNYSKRAMERIIELACEVAGLEFGNDLTINLG